MRRRALFIELFLEHERPEQRHITRYLDDTALLTLQPRLCAACWGLLRHWDAAGRPAPSRTNASFLPWSNIVGGIIEAAGYPPPLADNPLRTAGNRALEDMRALVTCLLGDQQNLSFTFAEVLSIARENGLFDWILTEDDTLDRNDKSRFSKLINKYDHRVLHTLHL